MPTAATAGGGEPVRIGACISGHGFGHATRTIAVLQALGRCMNIEVVLVTTAPAGLFAESLTMPYRIHAHAVDVGLVQHNALVEDIPATLESLATFQRQEKDQVDRIAQLLAGCRLVLCDIAPLGIAAARQAGVPSLLMENFTWDWIYAAYADQWPGLQTHVEALATLFDRADYRIQTQPVCRLADCDCRVEPVARPLRQPERLRQRLFLEPGQHLIVLTMGGLGHDRLPLPQLLQRPDVVFALPGWSRENEFTGNLRFLGREDSWYHPDLLAAADLVVGKLGYSTVAEAYQAGTPYAYVPRQDFAESAVLAAFVDTHLPSWRIEPDQWECGRWLAALPPLPVQRSIVPHGAAKGADQTADWLTKLLLGSEPSTSR